MTTPRDAPSHRHTATAASSPQKANAYFVLQAETLLLVVPQETIGKVRHLGDDTIEKIHSSHHVLQRDSILNGKTIYFAALTDDLTLLPTLPKERFLLTTFTDYPDIFWCWRDLYQVSHERCERFYLPPIVRHERTPVHALAILDGQHHGFFSTPDDIIHFALQGVG